MMRLLWLASLQAVLCVKSVPRFDIDFDKPPQERYRAIHEYFKESSRAMMNSTKKNLAVHFSDAELAEWASVVKGVAGEETLQELEGILEALGLPEDDFDTLLLSNVLYELASPTLCSGVVAANPQGQVIHGRNMDYRLEFQLPNGSVEDWPNVTYEAYYFKGGKPVFMSIGWALYTGVHTGMRFGGWTFEQNTRPGNNATQNLAAGKKGGIPFGWFVKELLATVPDFQTALRKINSTSFMAPQYFIMSGSQPYEGAVVSMDRLAAESLPNTPPVRFLGPGNWYLLQTNDDVNKLPADPRRPLTNLCLLWYTTEDVNLNNIWDLMLGPTLHDYLTVFTWVAIPSTNYSKLALPGEPAPTSLLQGQLTERSSASEEVSAVRQMLSDNGFADSFSATLAERFMANSLKKSPAILGGNGKRWHHVVTDEGISLTRADAI